MGNNIVNIIRFYFYKIFEKLIQKIKVKRKKIVTEIPNSEKPHPLIQVILSSAKTEFSSDELDVLFGIDYMEQESKKMKRHRLLIKLNEIHPNLITRVKDQFDKRKAIFKVNKV